MLELQEFRKIFVNLQKNSGIAMILLLIGARTPIVELNVAFGDIRIRGALCQRIEPVPIIDNVYVYTNW